MSTPPVSADRAPIGTTYLAPDQSLYRIQYYEQPLGHLGEPDVPEEPVFAYLSVRGGAAITSSPLPDDSVPVVLPTPDRPIEGSLFVTADGTAYRLRDYSVDFAAEPFTGEKTMPSYTVLLPHGACSTAQSLPADARMVWAPTT